MKSKFEFIKKIEDVEFLNEFKKEGEDGKERGLYDRCVEIIDDYQNSRYEVCLQALRPISEELVKYVYFRLFSTKWEDIVFILVGDQQEVDNMIRTRKNSKEKHNARKQFRDAVGKTFIRDADALRKCTNESIHNDDKESDLKREAEKAIDNIAYLLEEANKIIQRRNKESVSKKPIKGKVLIEQKPDEKNSGKEILKVKVEEANFQVYDKKRENRFKWIVLKKGERKEEYSFLGGPILTLEEKNYGRQFVCEISRPNELSGSISNSDLPYEVERGGQKTVKKKMTGEVVVNYKEIWENGHLFLSLTAILSDYRECEEYIYTWYLEGNEKKGANGRREPSIERNIGNNELRILPEDYKGKVLICRVTHEGWSGFVLSKPVLVQSETKKDRRRDKKRNKKRKVILGATISIVSSMLIIFLLILFGKFVANNKNSEDKVVELAGWGPERQTYTMAAPADHAVFNSITDNSAIGDERDFVKIVEKGTGNAYSSKINLEPNKEYDVYICYHNNASATYNDKELDYVGVATDVRLASSFPQELVAGAGGAVSGVVSWTTLADRNNVQEVWDEAWATATKNMTLHYVAGSAKIYNGGKTNGNVLSTSLFSEQGTYLGYDDLNGILPGCDEYAGHVNYTIQTQAIDTPVKPFVFVLGIFSAAVLILIIVAGIVWHKKHKSRNNFTDPDL